MMNVFSKHPLMKMRVDGFHRTSWIYVENKEGRRAWAITESS